MSAEVMMAEQLATMGVDGGAKSVKVGYGFSLADTQNFSGAMNKASEQYSVQSTSSTESLKKALSPLTNLNAQSNDFSNSVNSLDPTNFKPSDMIELTIKSHEFLFQAEITANVANRSSDGVQQLFRQQS